MSVKVVAGLGHVAPTQAPGQDQVVETGDGLTAARRAGTGLVLMEAYMAAPMQLAFDAPVAATECQQPLMASKRADKLPTSSRTLSTSWGSVFASVLSFT
jgi:hypothetical protein